ncbi:putative ribonuclease H protein [Camellia lanceoleosa]|uniref:Ribonuclease H protein n=1 Tax=Camellia lanceoleosa TaxID=1840588 RepID=A0ACC0FJC9_9ERIC|nr:putative ribonuclease H protein [Camellia lanceoleosa]
MRKIIWGLETPPKIRHFWWKVCHNLLATKASLVRRKCGTSAVCPICLSATEIVEHLLFDCSWAKAVWFGSSLKLRIALGSIPNVAQWTSDLIRQALSTSDAKTFLSTIATVGWFIWKSRNNEVVFTNIPVDPLATLHRISQFWTEQEDLLCATSNRAHRPASLSSTPVSEWIPANYGCFKINCDASFCQRNSTAAIAAVIRDSNGHLIDGNARTVSASSASQAEAYAVRMACLMVRGHKMSFVEIESDNQLVIKLCVSEQVPPWELSAIIMDIRSFASAYQLSFSWTNRSNNRVANWMAQTQASQSLPVSWAVLPPVSFLSLLSADVSSFVG